VLYPVELLAHIRDGPLRAVTRSRRNRGTLGLLYPQPLRNL